MPPALGNEIDRLVVWMVETGRSADDAVPSWISDETWRWVQNNRRELAAMIQLRKAVA